MKRSKSWKIASISGINIELHYTWFIIIVLLAYGLAVDFFPSQFPELNAVETWIVAVISAVLLFASVLFHELSHSFVALKNKIKVEKVTLFFFGGIAQIHPEKLNPKREFDMAIAGPISSLLLAGLFMFLLIFAPWPIVKAISFYLARINFILAVFNLVPGYPLDGGRVLRAILWHFMKDIKRATYIAAYGGKVFAVTLIVLGIISFVQGGIWLILLGGFLYIIAGLSYQQTVIRDTLDKVKAKDIMDKKPVTIDPNLKLSNFFEKYILPKEQEEYAVVKNKKYYGIVNIQCMAGANKKLWDKISVKDVMIKKYPVVTKEKKVYPLLEFMTKQGFRTIPVIDKNQFSGVVTQGMILHYLKLKKI